MTCNLCGGPIWRPQDFDRGYCDLHETLIESGVVVLHSHFAIFDLPEDLRHRLLNPQKALQMTEPERTAIMVTE